MRSLIDILARASRCALPLLTVLSIPLGFLFLEFPANVQIDQMDPYYLQVNAFIAAAIFLIIYGLGQRTRGSVIAYLAVCLVAGLANYFVISFKGQPITPADLSALSTALSVSGGYEYALNDRSVICILLFFGMCAALMLQPGQKAPMKAPTAVLNVACAMAIVIGFSTWFTETDITEGYDVSIDVWSQKESYAEQGTALCFLKRVQDIVPQEPSGYDQQTATSLVHGFEMPMSADGAVQHASYSGKAATEAPADIQDLPTVIVIMNETFSDLSEYPGLEGTAAEPAAFNAIAKGAIASGDAYVSALGGGTCNSEFEFLTGSSMGHLGGGVYPYTMYDLSGTENLVSHLGNLGYATFAIHPESPTNWSRNRVYAQLGFDQFISKSAFEGADTLRDRVVDRATYDLILEMMEDALVPQFFFDVTMQNHSGYDTGLIPTSELISVPMPDGQPFAELDEYVSCLQRSDADLAYFIERLEACERPVYLCFFGDHQPSFADELFERTHGGATADEIGGIDAAQERYKVPYIIWGNHAALASAGGRGSAIDTGDKRVSSLNYLASQLCETASIPLTGYQRFLLDTSQVIPAINMNGFLDATGTWQGYGWNVDETTQAALVAYSCVQYDNLFDKAKSALAAELAS